MLIDMISDDLIVKDVMTMGADNRADYFVKCEFLWTMPDGREESSTISHNKNGSYEIITRLIHDPWARDSNGYRYPFESYASDSTRLLCWFMSRRFTELKIKESDGDN